MLFLSNKIKSPTPAAFESRVVEIANDLGIDPNWLMIVMYFESGLNPSAVNKISGATGLIQFMPQTAQRLGTSTDELKTMDAISQLAYVEKYLSAYKGKMASLTDVYLSVFYPAAVGKEDFYILGGSNAELVARQNRTFDANKDGLITKAEVTQYIEGYAKRLGWIEKYKKFAILPIVLIFFCLIHKF